MFTLLKKIIRYITDYIKEWREDKALIEMEEKIRHEYA